MRVINTRPSGQNQELSRLLKQAGFEPLEIPLVDILPSEGGMTRARKLSPTAFTGIFLSSVNGLRHFHEGLGDAGFERWLEKPFYLVGEKAKPLVEKLGGRVAFCPKEASLEGFLKEYRPGPGPGGLVLAQRWLHPCSASTRLEPEAFRGRSVEVENLHVYKPGLPEAAAARLQEAGEAAAAIFCSGSAVEHFFQAGPEWKARLGASPGMLAISIGASTTKALREHGVEHPKESGHADNASLVDALKAACSGEETHVLKRKKLEGKT